MYRFNLQYSIISESIIVFLFYHTGYCLES